jgi:hypothetical protein
MAPRTGMEYRLANKSNVAIDLELDRWNVNRVL